MKFRETSWIPSLVKKYLMALTGLIMVLFVLVHMVGNLQMFLGADVINHYAHLLQTLPRSILWGFRGILLLSLIVHVWMAILITSENRAARPQGYYKVKRVQATLASRTMGVSGSIILFFIVFHLLHYTFRIIFPEYQTDAFYTVLDGGTVYNVYKMMLVGFSKIWVSGIYIFSMIFLCMHLTHAVWSMFQTLGYCDGKWRNFLKKVSLVYGWMIFLGFVSLPIAVLGGYFKGIDKSEIQINTSERPRVIQLNS